MRDGVNVLPLTQHPPARGWLDTAKMPVRGVVVRQDVWKQTARLLAYSGDRPGLSVLPEVKLAGRAADGGPGHLAPRDALRRLPGRSTRRPCVAAADVKIENPTAYLDKGGALPLRRQHLDAGRRGPRRRSRDKFTLPVSVGGKRLLSFDWPLHFERPQNVVFIGEPGPAPTGRRSA